MTYKEKLLDPRWQKKRLEILNRDDWSCQWCGDKETTLHVHHEYYEKGIEPWEADDFCLTTVCADCHNLFHLMKTPLERYLFTCFRNSFKRDGGDMKMFNRVINHIAAGGEEG
jgi:5-methylcytosine-specific restriction endonuclease McrA